MSYIFEITIPVFEKNNFHAYYPQITEHTYLWLVALLFQATVVCVSPTENGGDTREAVCTIKFCFLLKHILTETCKTHNQAYGECALLYSTDFRWFKDFEEGRISTVKQGGLGVSVSALTEVNINTAAVIVCSRRLPRPVSILGAELIMCHHVFILLADV